LKQVYIMMHGQKKIKLEQQIYRASNTPSLSLLFTSEGEHVSWIKGVPHHFDRYTCLFCDIVNVSQYIMLSGSMIGEW